MPSNDKRPLRKSFEEYGRGIAGGLLFSLPLLYTMEVWWTGFIVEPWGLIACVAITFALLLGYNRYGGMRPDSRLSDVVVDSIEELGIGVLLATFTLYLLGRIKPGMALDAIVGKIVVESMIVSIGVSVGTAQLGMSGQEEDGEGQGSGTGGGSDEQNDSGERNTLVGEMVLAFCGAVLFAANVAPTMEVVVIAAEASPWKLIGLALLSLAIGAIILYFSGFLNARTTLRHHKPLGMILETTANYAVALLASALMLWFFRRFDGASLVLCISETVVLAFPGTLGASAGRLLIQ